MSFKDKIWLYLLGGEYPTVSGYTVLDGFVSGSELRFESFAGGELWIKSTESFPDGVRWGYSDKHGEVGFLLNGLKPFIEGGKTWSISALQKKSYHGFLKCQPDAYWFWTMTKLQDRDAAGNFIPRTERGTCFRGIPSWRIDFAGTPIDGVLRNWIASGGHIGPRYD